MPLLKGKMCRRSPIRHSKLTKLRLPLDFLRQQKDLNLYVDIFFVNGSPFFLSKSGNINYISATFLKSRKASEILQAIKRDINKYEKRGFHITDMHGDNEFDIDAIKDAILPTIVHAYSKNEHVGEVENTVKFIKMRARCVCHSTPYKRFIILMTRSLIELVVDMINVFPRKNGVSDTMSPAAMVDGKNKLDMGMKMLAFGSYAMVYVGTENNMKQRSVPGI